MNDPFIPRIQEVVEEEHKLTLVWICDRCHEWGPMEIKYSESITSQIAKIRSHHAAATDWCSGTSYIRVLSLEVFRETHPNVFIAGNA